VKYYIVPGEFDEASDKDRWLQEVSIGHIKVPTKFCECDLSIGTKGGGWKLGSKYGWWIHSCGKPRPTWWASFMFNYLRIRTPEDLEKMKVDGQHVARMRNLPEYWHWWREFSSWVYQQDRKFRQMMGLDRYHAHIPQGGFEPWKEPGALENGMPTIEEVDTGW
jgi:hypothetical protein